MKGTYWYHSHIGAQRSNGAFGALIIKEREKENASSPRDMIATVGDWHHLHSSEVRNYKVHIFHPTLFHFLNLYNKILFRFHML